MIRHSKEGVEQGLRYAAGRNQRKTAAAELLVEHGTWPEAWSLNGEKSPTSANNVSQFTNQVYAPTLGSPGTPFVSVGWERMAEHLESAGHTYSTTEVNVFRLAASLWAGVPVDMAEVTVGLDTEHARMIADAVATAAGLGGARQLAARVEAAYAEFESSVGSALAEARGGQPAQQRQALDLDPQASAQNWVAS
ncbi:hypothetical protein ABZT26_25885 [Streptomyces sp. NPDC005395]|uniref:hypothetical protein n=1 Tax=Streptomyces sp. NPDC005395 TaxID=3157042 RepID=UPI0033AAFA4A